MEEKVKKFGDGEEAKKAASTRGYSGPELKRPQLPVCRGRVND